MSAYSAGVMGPIVRNSKFQSIIVAFLTVLSYINSSEVPRPRGVSLSRASLYNSDRNFLCFDNSKTIPFSQVNDDYCDCLDGSDEPGTSACPNGIFYCTNAGHKPLNLPSSRVNDGICDCCDGSDEYGRTEVDCPDICLQLGRHAREEAQRLAELIEAGKHLKQELSQRGVQLKQEKKNKLVELKKNKDEADKVKEEKRILKDKIEPLENQALEQYRKLEEEEKKRKAEIEAAKNREEAADTFTQFDSNQDGYVEISEVQVRQTFDKDKNGEVSVEEARYFLNQEEAVNFDKFLTDAWPNIKPYLMMDAGLFKPPAKETADEVEDVQSEDEAEDQEESPQDDEAEEDEDEEEPEEQVDEPPKYQQYDEETQKLVDEATAARSEFSEAERAVRDIENEIKDIQEYLEKDFGPDEEFATLEGECFDYTDHEYIYKLCPFDKTTQLPKSGSVETRLGAWSRWDGPEDDKYEAMLYDKGQNCWNGPQRSTKVKVVCGTENNVISVSEPNRCEYQFEFTTPAACRELTSAESDTHDEL